MMSASDADLQCMNLVCLARHTIGRITVHDSLLPCFMFNLTSGCSDDYSVKDPRRGLYTSCLYLVKSIRVTQRIIGTDDLYTIDPIKILTPLIGRH